MSVQSFSSVTNKGPFRDHFLSKMLLTQQALCMERPE